MPRPRSILAALLAAFAIGELIVIGLIFAGIEGATRLGPIRISIHQVDRPLWIGLALSTWILAQEWRSRAWRRLGFVLILSFGLFALVNLAREAPPFRTLMDIAVIELYVRLAITRGLLVGPYSRFVWHHPGPLYFWMQAPFYAMAGQQGAGLYAGAVAMNLAALAVFAWVTTREDRGSVAALSIAAVVLFAWRALGLLASPWTAHVPVLASLAFMAVAAGLATGRLGLLPLLVLVGTFIAQTHVAYVPLVGVLSAGALASAWYWRPRDRTGSFWPMINRSAWLFVALWLPPLAEQVSHPHGNFTQLWQFFVADRQPGHPFTVAFTFWSDALMGILRPEVALPWGGHYQPTHTLWSAAGAVAQVALLAVVASSSARAGRRFEASFAVVALVASVVGLWAVTQIRGDILDHETFPLVGLGALNMALIAASGFRAARDWCCARWQLARPLSNQALAAICAVVALLAVPTGLRDFNRLIRLEGLRRRDMATVEAAGQAIRRYMATAHVAKPRLAIDPLIWGFAASTIVDLEKAGIPLAVEGAWRPMFTDAFASTGREDAVVSFGGLGVHQSLGSRPDNVVLLESHPVYIDAVKINP